MFVYVDIDFNLPCISQYNELLVVFNSSAMVPQPRELTKKDIAKLAEVGIHLIKSDGIFTTVGIRNLDSRTESLGGFLKVLQESDIGKSPVRLAFLTGPVGERISSRVMYREFSMGIVSMNWAKCTGTQHSTLDIGCFEIAREAIPRVVEFLQNPPLTLCPSASNMQSGDCAATLNIDFMNFFVDANIFIP